MRRSLTLLGLLQLAACADLLGIERGETASGGMTGTAGGGAVGTAGTGGTAGGGATVPFDWTPAMDAVFRYENNLDSATGSPDDLRTSGPAPEYPADKREGDFSVELAPTHYLTSSAPMFGRMGDQAFTFGTWVKVRDARESTIVSRFSPADESHINGYRLYRAGSEPNFICQAGDGSTGPELNLVRGPPANLEWTHVACRHIGGVLTSFGGGFMADSDTVMLGTNGDFRVGDVDDQVDPLRHSLDGLVDETFFVASALSDASIARIATCGIRGDKCACKDDDATEYLDCNDGNCDALVDCNEPTPLTE